MTYAFHLRLVGKRVIDFLFATIENFLLALTVQTLGRYWLKSARGVGQFQCKFQAEGDIAHKRLLVSVNYIRVIILSFGIKISEVLRSIFRHKARM